MITIEFWTLSARYYIPDTPVVLELEDSYEKWHFVSEKACIDMMHGILRDSAENGAYYNQDMMRDGEMCNFSDLSREQQTAAFLFDFVETGEHWLNISKERLEIMEERDLSKNLHSS